MRPRNKRLLALLFALPLFGSIPALGQLPIADIPENAHAWGLPKVPHEADHQGQSPRQAETARAVVVVRDLPTSDLPETGPLREHIQGEFLQDGDWQSEPESPVRFGPGIDSPAPAPNAPDTAGTVLHSFDGISDTGWIPPDTILAAGSSHLLEATNSHFSGYLKNGTLSCGPINFATFLAPILPAGWSGNIFDPRVVHHPSTGQFLFLMLGVDNLAQTSYFFIGVSQTGNPCGSWWIWRIVANDTGAGGSDSDSWADYAGLGVDSWGIYVTTNLFRWTGGFKYSALHCFNIGMLAGGASNGSRFWDLRWPDGGSAFSLQPAHPHSVAGGSETFFVNSYPGSGTALNLWTLTGDRTNSPTLVKSQVSVNPYYAIGENIEQPGSTVNLDGGDSRIMNAVYSNRQLWTTLTTDVNNNELRSGAVVVKMNVDSRTVTAQRNYYSTDGTFFFYPAVTVAGGSAQANVVVFMNWTQPATNTYASGAALILSPDLQTTPAFPGVVSGQAAYVKYSSGVNRWGDYSGASWDWTNGTAWGAVEYAKTGNLWGTRISEIEVPGVSAPGADTIGVRRASTLYLKNANSSGAADLLFNYGISTDVSLVGDWNGDGIDTVGIRRGSTFFLRNSNSSGAADLSFNYGISTDVPVVGDWNGL